jgi:hypothetical protein
MRMTNAEGWNAAADAQKDQQLSTNNNGRNE